MQARSIGSASQLSHRAAAARSANTNSARSSPKPLTWPKRWNLTKAITLPQAGPVDRLEVAGM